MLGRLYQVAIPTDVFDGAEVIRVVDVIKTTPKELGIKDTTNKDDKEDFLYQM